MSARKPVAKKEDQVIQAMREEVLELAARVRNVEEQIAALEELIHCEENTETTTRTWLQWLGGAL
jgi:hypothetical protein